MPDEFKRSIAIYENGVAVIAMGERNTDGVQMFLKAARKAQLDVKDIVEVRPEQLLALYESEDQADDPAGNGEVKVRRQEEAKEIIAAAVSRKASDIHIIVGKQGHANIWFRSYGRRMRYRTMAHVEAMMMIEAIFAVGRDIVGNPR